MALPEKTVVVQFARGVETKQDRKGVMAGQMLALENAVFSKAISFVKRFGYEALGATVLGRTTPLPKPYALGRRGYELLAFGGGELFSYNDDLDSWASAGPVRSVVCDLEPALKTGSNQTIADMDEMSGVAAYAWEDSRGGVWMGVVNDYTGNVIVPPVQMDALGQQPRVHAVGSYLHVYYARPSSQEIRVWRIDPASPTERVESVLVTDASGAPPLYDIDTDPDNGRAVIAYRDTSLQITVAYVHQTAVIGGGGLGLATPVSVAEDPSNALGVAIDKTDAGRRIAVVWSDADEVLYSMLDDGLVQLFSAKTAVDEGLASTQVTCVFLRDSSDAGFRLLWIGSQDDDSIAMVRMRLVDSAGGLSILAERDQRGLVLGSKAFRDDDDAYIHTQRGVGLHRTYYTQRMSDGLVVARFLPRQATGFLPRRHLPSVSFEVGVEGRAVRFASVYVTDAGAADGNVFGESGIQRVSLDFASPDSYRSVQLGKSLYISGGYLQVYDGERVQEAGFHYGPDEFPASLGAPTTGPGMVDGVRGYVLCYENPLANGEVERGPVSPTVLVEVTAGPRRVTIQAPTYRWTTKPGMRIGVFRSQPGDASVFNRVSNLDPGTVGDVNGYVANDDTVDAVTFVDEMDDETAFAQDPLYTNGGIPSNDPTGPVRLLAGGKNRLFYVDSALPNRMGFTQELADGFAVESVPALGISVDPFGGDINGLFVMDDAVYPLKETAVFLVEGTGPLANPDVGGGFTQPQLVTSDVGCLAPDSIGYTPIGGLFQAQKGIYLLGRDRAVKYIGAPVEAYNSQRIVATTLIEDRTQIRLLTDSGKTLLYDYLFDQWSTFGNHEGQDAALVDGAYHYLRNDGSVVVETLGAYRDVNRNIRMAMETSWLNLAGHLQGWQFLWFVTFIGEWKSNHQLRVYTAFDYEEGWTGAPIVIDPADSRITSPYGEGPYGGGPYGGYNDTRYQFEIHVGQECESVRFRFEDVEPTGEFGASFELTELILTGGVQRSTYGVEESRSY